MYELGGEEWKEFIVKMNSGEKVLISEDMYYYWLEVLPPIYVGMNWRFGFAEGYDYIVDFWKEDEEFYCKRSNKMNEE